MLCSHNNKTDITWVTGLENGLRLEWSPQARRRCKATPENSANLLSRPGRNAGRLSLFRDDNTSVIQRTDDLRTFPKVQAAAARVALTRNTLDALKLLLQTYSI